jgi:hypothetical protein
MPVSRPSTSAAELPQEVAQIEAKSFTTHPIGTVGIIREFFADGSDGQK